MVSKGVRKLVSQLSQTTQRDYGAPLTWYSRGRDQYLTSIPGGKGIAIRLSAIAIIRKKGVLPKSEFCRGRVKKGTDAGPKKANAKSTTGRVI